MPDQSSRPPTAWLTALTREATAAIGGRPSVEIEQYPFRIGRESRQAVAAREVERRLGITARHNDLYLVEPPSRRLFVSREHMLIDFVDGCFHVVDRESSCGTVVGGHAIGGNRQGGWAAIAPGDEVVFGPPHSPYRFRFEVLADTRPELPGETHAAL